MATKMVSHQELMDNSIDWNANVPLLAHGDSWGSFGSALPWLTGSLIERFDFGRDVGIVNYAMPGQLLRDLPNAKRYPTFHLAVTLRGMPKWKALLLSGGGNDLIDWISRGPGNDLAHRVLRYRSEWLPTGTGPMRFISQSGWTGLCQEMLQAYQQLDALRNKYQPQMRLVTHLYDYMTPRFAPALNGVSGPWMAPALRAADIPQTEWGSVAHTLIDLFHDFLTRQVQPAIQAVTVLDTRGGATPADPGTKGPSHDWQNEIHLTTAGYKQLAKDKCNRTLKQLASGW